MSAVVEVALIGAGVMGRQHYQFIAKNPDIKLVAIADPGPGAADFAEQCAVAYFTDHQQMLEQVRPHAVIIANPNALHVRTTLDCLAAGVAVLLEKPVGVDMAEVLELVEATRNCSTPVLVGHHRRHNPLVAKAHELLQQEVLGRLTTVTALWQLQKPDSYFDIPWRREPGAGMLLTNLIHDLDLLRHLCGEVSHVQAVTSNGVRGFANEDSMVVLLQFENGALGTLTGSDAVAAPWSWELTSGENPVYPQQTDQGCYLLAGTLGALSLPQLKHWSYSQAGAGWHQPLQATEQAYGADDSLRLQLAHFVEVVRGHTPPLVSVESAARTLALLDAIRTAAQTGRSCQPQVI